jgi:hypothetical protein
MCLDDLTTAKRLLLRALALHATPDVRALWRVVTVSAPDRD